MSAESNGYTDPYRGGDLEPAAYEEIHSLVMLAERALEQGDVVTESLYGYACDYGSIVFKTRISYVADNRVRQNIVSLYGSDHSVDYEDKLLEFVYNEDGKLDSEFILGTRHEDSSSQLYAAIVDITNICQISSLGETLDPQESKVLKYINNICDELTEPSPQNKTDKLNLGLIINNLVDEFAVLTLSTTNFSKELSNEDQVSVTGYLVHQGVDEEMFNFPKLVVSRKEKDHDITTKFIAPANGKGLPELYSYIISEGESEAQIYYDEEELDQDRMPEWPHRQGITMLTESLTSILMQDALHEIEIELIGESEESNDLLQELLELANQSYKNLEQADPESEEAAEWKTKLGLVGSSLKRMIESRYNLIENILRSVKKSEDELDYEISQVDKPSAKSVVLPQSTQIELLRASGQNRLFMQVPYVWTDANIDRVPKIVNITEGVEIEVFYHTIIGTHLKDALGKSIYDGICLVGVLIMENPLDDDLLDPTNDEIFFDVAIPMEYAKILPWSVTN